MSNEEPPQAAPLRAPAFTLHDPTIWFTILEVNFRAIASSLAQFSHACTLQPSDVVSQVSDAIASASTSNTPYETS